MQLGLLLLTLLATLAPAQTVRGSIAGRVTDPAHRPIHRAIITLRHQETNRLSETATSPTHRTPG